MGAHCAQVDICGHYYLIDSSLPFIALLRSRYSIYSPWLGGAGYTTR